MRIRVGVELGDIGVNVRICELFFFQVDEIERFTSCAYRVTRDVCETERRSKRDKVIRCKENALHGLLELRITCIDIRQ